MKAFGLLLVAEARRAVDEAPEFGVLFLVETEHTSSLHPHAVRILLCRNWETSHPFVQARLSTCIDGLYGPDQIGRAPRLTYHWLGDRLDYFATADDGPDAVVQQGEHGGFGERTDFDLLDVDSRPIIVAVLCDVVAQFHY